MYQNKCTKCGKEFETRNPKRVICPDCLYPEKSSTTSENETPQENYTQEGTTEKPSLGNQGGYNRPQGGYSQGGNQGGYNRPQGGYSQGGNQGGYNRPQGGYSQGGNQGGYNRPQGGYSQGGNQGGYNRPQGGYSQGGNQGGFNRPQGGYSQGGNQGGFNRPQGGYSQGGNQGGFNRPQGGGGFNRGGFGGGFNRGPQRRPAPKQLLISREQVAEIENLYKLMLPLPNPDAHEVIGEKIGLESQKVFFGINLVRQKMMLPKLPFPKRKLAVSPDQLIAILTLYTPLLPLPPIGCHKILAKQLKMDEWRVHVGIGIVRKQLNLPRWNSERDDAPEEFKNKPQEEIVEVKEEKKAKAPSKAKAKKEEVEEVVEKKEKTTKAKTKKASTKEDTAEVEAAPKKRGRAKKDTQAE